MKNDALFCVSQKAFIEKDGKVLVLHDPIEGLDFPGGKIQEGESKNGEAASLLRSLQRETREETGLEIAVGDPFAVWYHEFPKNHRNYGKVVYLVAFKCKYVSGELELSEEHDKFRWVGKNDYTEVDDGSDYFDVLEKYFSEKDEDKEENEEEEEKGENQKNSKKDAKPGSSLKTIATVIAGAALGAAVGASAAFTTCKNTNNIPEHVNTPATNINAAVSAPSSAVLPPRSATAGALPTNSDTPGVRP